MPRVTFVKSAQKDNPVAKKGEPYYWWKFRFGGKHYSKTPPKPSQLTQSGFLSALLGLGESLPSSMGEEELDEVIAEVEAMRDECQDSLDAMPEALQDSSILVERIDALNEWLEDMERIDLDDLEDEEREGESEDARAERIEAAKARIAEEVAMGFPDVG